MIKFAIIGCGRISQRHAGHIINKGKLIACIDVIDEKAKYTDWNKRDDIRAELHFDLIILLDEWDYPPIDRDEVYKEIFEQAENFKKYGHLSE